MTTAPARDAVPAYLPEAISRAGQEIVDRVDLGPVTQRLATLPTAALLSELDAILGAIDSADPARSRRRAGLIGRLLGRDLTARAEPDPPENRVRVHLLRAEQRVAELHAHLRYLEEAGTALDGHLEALGQSIEQARSRLASAADVPAALIDHGRRRIQYLEAIGASWGQARGQIRFAHDHGRTLIARYEHVRDLLVPLWRQHATARALNDTLAAGDAQRLAALHRDAVAALAALHAPPASIPSTPPTAPADREPAP